MNDSINKTIISSIVDSNGPKEPQPVLDHRKVYLESA